MTELLGTLTALKFCTLGKYLVPGTLPVTKKFYPISPTKYFREADCIWECRGRKQSPPCCCWLLSESLGLVWRFTCPPDGGLVLTCPGRSKWDGTLDCSTFLNRRTLAGSHTGKATVYLYFLHCSSILSLKLVSIRGLFRTVEGCWERVTLQQLYGVM